MRFAQRVFVGAGIWGILTVAPLYFVVDTIERQRSLPITYQQFYFGFIAVTLAWQLAFIVIGSNPVRFRPLMIAGMAEKFGFLATMGVLYLRGQVAAAEIFVVSPDLLLGVLFVVAFAKARVPVEKASH